MIKVGLIGGGGIADAHIRGYRTYADAIEVTAVADVVDQTARRRAAELDAVAYLDFRQMILEADHRRCRHLPAALPSRRRDHRRC